MMSSTVQNNALQAKLFNDEEITLYDFEPVMETLEKIMNFPLVGWGIRRYGMGDVNILE